MKTIKYNANDPPPLSSQGGCILLTSHMMQPPYSGSSSQNIGFLMESRCHLPNEQVCAHMYRTRVVMNRA